MRSRGSIYALGAGARKSLVLFWTALFLCSLLLQYVTFAAPPAVLAVHSGEFELDGATVRRPTEAGLDHAVAVEDQGRWGLQHVEVLGDVRPMRQIDVEMQHAFAIVRDGGQSAVHAGAAAAHLGAELQQCGALAQCARTEPVRLDDFARILTARTILLPTQVRTDADRRREQRGEDEGGIRQIHNSVLYPLECSRV